MSRFKGFGGSTIKVSKRGKAVTLYRKKKPTVRQIVKKAINQMAEHKYYNPTPLTNSAVADPSVGATLGVITSVPQGLPDLSRDGDSLTMKNLFFRGNIYSASGGTSESNIVRVIIFQWHQNTQSVTPSTASILSYIAAGQGVASPYVHDQLKGKNYTIMYDRRFCVSDYGPGCVQFKGNLVPKRKKIQFNGAGLTGTNHLYYLILSDSVAINHPTITINFQVNFLDM